MANFVTKEKLFSSRWFQAYFFILIGTISTAAGYVFFVTPYYFVPGGVYGISIVIHHLLGFPMGLVALCFNIPLTIIGIRILGPRFGIKTIVGFILTAFFIELFTWLADSKPLVEDQQLLSAVFGATLIGIGVGFLFKAKATVGGSDVIAMILAKYTRLPLGQLMVMVDSVIVILGLVAFRKWEIPLFSWIILFIMGKVIDVVLQGVSFERALFIISEKHDEIRNKLVNDLKRGGTFINGVGMYNGQEKKIIYTTVSRREVEIIKDYIKEIDPTAFITVLEAYDVIGKGFKSLNDPD